MILLAFWGHARAESCGDADGNGSVTVTDGVQVLRAAADLSTTCSVSICDVDGNGAITVTDGVNVLRVAAGLLTTLSCDIPTQRFIDNGDGTVSDNETGLQWEKKTGNQSDFRDCFLTPCPDPHDVNNTYQWCLDADLNFECDDATNPPNGGAFTDFLVKLNTAPCFAGHCDWRLPTMGPDGDTAELETIVDLSAEDCGNGSPCIDPIFDPTVTSFYWSASTIATDPSFAWGVKFSDGIVFNGTKGNTFYVRAVRAGS
jgi:hypothetical protein